MRQPPINLIPESIRVRSHAGVVGGRCLAALLIAVSVLIATATHSRFVLDRARELQEVAQARADLVGAAETEAGEFRDMRRETRQFIHRYKLTAWPVELSRILATVVNELPPSATLDRIDLQAGPRRRTRSARSRGLDTSNAPPPRVLYGELSGFAATDQDLAEIVSRLEALGFFQQVSLDFSRTRSVRGHGAREFRISFQVDLEAEYDVADRVVLRRQPSGEGVIHAR